MAGSLKCSDNELEINYISISSLLREISEEKIFCQLRSVKSFCGWNDGYKKQEVKSKSLKKTINLEKKKHKSKKSFQRLAEKFSNMQDFGQQKNRDKLHMGPFSKTSHERCHKLAKLTKSRSPKPSSNKPSLHKDMIRFKKSQSIFKPNRSCDKSYIYQDSLLPQISGTRNMNKSEETLYNQSSIKLPSIWEKNRI